MRSRKAGSRVLGTRGCFVENRGPLCDGGDTRSSLHLSMVTLGCLDEGDKRGERQGCYLS